MPKKIPSGMRLPKQLKPQTNDFTLYIPTYRTQSSRVLNPFSVTCDYYSTTRVINAPLPFHSFSFLSHDSFTPTKENLFQEEMPRNLLLQCPTLHSFYCFTSHSVQTIYIYIVRNDIWVFESKKRERKREQE